MTLQRARTLRAGIAAGARDQGASRRRLRLAHRLYCSTNGCTSYLELDRTTGLAICPICGYRRSVTS